MALKTDGFRRSLSQAANETKEAANKINKSLGIPFEGLETLSGGISSAFSDVSNIITSIINPIQKLDSVITGVTDTVVNATKTAVTASADFAKSFDSTIIGAADQLDSKVADAFNTAASAAKTFFDSVYQEGILFEEAMGQVSATRLKTRENFDAEKVTVDGFTGSLRDLAKELGATTKFTATQAAQGLNYMALAGYDAQTSAEMLPKVLKLAAAGAMDLGTASDMVTDGQTALGLSLDDTSVLIDQMAKTASKSNTSVAQLGDAILAIGATGRQLKGGFSELNLALGVLADNGIKASEGGNDLRRILTRLTAPGDEAAEVMANLGFSAYDTQGSLKALPQIFQELQAAMSGMTEQQKAVTISTIFGQYALAGANSLLNTSAERWEELAKEIENSQDAADEMAKIQLETLAGQVTVLQSAFSGLKIEVFDLVASGLKDFVEILSNGLSNVTSEISGGNWNKAFDALGDTFSALIVEGIDTAAKNRDTIIEIADGIINMFGTVANTIMSNAAQIVVPLFEVTSTIAGNALSALASFMTDSKNVQKIQGVLTYVFVEMRDFFSNNYDNIYSIFSTGFDLAVEIIGNLATIKREVVYSLVFDKIQEILTTLTDDAAAWFGSKKAANFVDKILNKIGEALNNVINSAETIIPNAIKFIVDIADKVVTGLANWLSDDLNTAKIRSSINLILSSIETFLDEHEDDIYTIFDTFFDNCVDIIERIFLLRRKTTARLIWNKITDIAEAILEFPPDTTPLGKIGGFLASGIFEGFKGGIVRILKGIPAISDSIIDKIKETFGIASPSKVMRDEVGKFLALGVEDGFTTEMKKISGDMVGAIPTDFNISPEITPVNSNSAGIVNVAFHIGTINGTSEQDTQAFGNRVSEMIYNSVYRAKAATI